MTSSADAAASCTSTQSRSSGPSPACSYAAAAARLVTLVIPSTGADLTADASTVTAGPDEHRSGLTSRAAAAPSEIGEHICRVNGQTISRAARTCSTVSSPPYWAYGFSLPCRWFLTTTRARSARVAPVRSMYRSADSAYMSMRKDRPADGRERTGLVRMGHLLGTDGQHRIVHAGRDGLPGEVERGGGRGTGVLDVEDRDPAQTERPEEELPGQHLLARHRSGDRVAEVTGLHVVGRPAGILQGGGDGLGGKVLQGG